MWITRPWLQGLQYSQSCWPRQRSSALPSRFRSKASDRVPSHRSWCPSSVHLGRTLSSACRWRPNSEALIFDTGTTTTVLVPALAARVGLSAGQATDVESLNGSQRGLRGDTRGIGFDGVPARGPRIAIATNVARLRGFTRSIAGLYGHNWLTGTDYRIDYDSKQIVMGAPGTLPPSTGGHRTALTWSAGRPAVTVMSVLTRWNRSWRASCSIPAPIT